MIWLFGYAVGIAIGMFLLHGDLKGCRAEAVKRGAAEWVVDPATGETEFRWKEVAP